LSRSEARRATATRENVTLEFPDNNLLAQLGGAHH